MVGLTSQSRDNYHGGRTERQAAHVLPRVGGEERRLGRKGTGFGATSRKSKDEEEEVLKWKMCNR